MPAHRIDLTGQRFGRLTVISYYGADKGQTKWNCICDCGNEHIAASRSLRHGDTRSCGCILREFNESQRTHGRQPRRLHRIWSGMKCRCHDPNNKDFRNYGARGISVSEEWSGFEAFRDWALSHGYRDDLTLDRIDVNGNYSPENCRWATAEEQANNRTNNHKVSYKGETKNVSEWAKQYGIDASLFHAAIRRGKTIDEIVSKYSEKGKI